jgi:hypothetical protein
LNALNNGVARDDWRITTAMERAFIQFAGFTLGRSDTFFAFYNGALTAFRSMDGSSGPGGLNVFAYTAVRQWVVGFISQKIVADGAPVNDLNGGGRPAGSNA